MDVEFRVTEVFKHAGALAERGAVIHPLGGSKDLVGDRAVEAAVGRVVEKWRRRCVVLQKAGLPIFQGVRFQYARNCPPVAVKCRVVGREGVFNCNAGQVCPWCWGRQVVKRAWDVVSGGMDRLSTLGTGEDPYKLVFVKRSFRAPDGERQPQALFDHLDGVMTRTARALRKKGAVGWAMLSVVHPGLTGSPEWTYGTRVLALVPQDYPPPDGSRTAQPTRRGVAVLVSRFARYPTGVMTGDPKATVRLLTARGSRRLLRFAGAFHGAGRRRQPPAEGRFLDL